MPVDGNKGPASLRFEYALDYLQDCFERDANLGASEHDYRVRLIKLCERIAGGFGSAGEDEDT